MDGEQTSKVQLGVEHRTEHDVLSSEQGWLDRSINQSAARAERSNSNSNSIA